VWVSQCGHSEGTDGWEVRGGLSLLVPEGIFARTWKRPRFHEPPGANFVLSFADVNGRVHVHERSLWFVHPASRACLGP
jgi:hypothetical protein